MSTAVADILGLWCFLRHGDAVQVGKKTPLSPDGNRVLFPANPHVGKSWADTYLNIRIVFDYPTIGKVFKALGEISGDIPVLLIRWGDIADQNAAGDAEHHYHIHATMTAILYAYLRNTRASEGKDAEYRYTRHPAGTPDTWGGYVADDWMRAILHLQFFNKRRLNAYRSALEGEGPKSAPIPPTRYMNNSDIGQQLRSDQHSSSEANV